MMSANRFFVRLSTAAFLLAMMSVFGVRLRAQDVPAVHVGDTTITGIPDDWTHHHVFFSDPGTEQDAVKNGTHEEWLKTVNDPRYVIQQLKRGLPAQGPAAQDVEMRQRINAQLSGTPYQGAQGGVTPERWTGPRGVEGGPRSFGPGATADVSKTPLTRDWSMNVGGTAASLTLTFASPLTTGTSTSNINPTTGTSTLTINGVALSASSPTAATEAGTFSGNPADGSQLTIGGTEILTASRSTQGTQTGTFLSPPTTAAAITVKLGSNTLTLKTNATTNSVVGTAGGGIPASSTQISVGTGTNTVTLTNSATPYSATGTVLAAPYSGTVPSPVITIQNVATGNTLTLLTSGSGSTATGFFSGTSPTAGPSVGQTIVMTEQQQANTLTLTGVDGGKGTITVSGVPGPTILGYEEFIIGGITYTFGSSSSPQCGTTANCIFDSDPGISKITMAGNIAAAITNNSAICGTAAPCFSAGTTAVANIGAVASTSGTNGLVTATNYSSAAVTWSYKTYLIGPDTDLTLSPTGSLPAGTANKCTSPNTGTFVINLTSAAGVAANVNAAINACLAAFPAVGVISTVSGQNINVSDTATGTYSTLTMGTNGAAIQNASNFFWGAVTPGSLGTNSCNGASSGFYETGSSYATAPVEVATNIANVINLCNTTYPSVGVSAVDNSNGTFTVTNPIPGPFLVLGATGTGVAHEFTWSAPSGSPGTTGCTTSTTGGYMPSATAAGLASNISAAINSCNTNFLAVGLTSAYTSGPSFTVTSALPGTAAAITTATATNATGIFSWGTPTTATDGSNACSSTTTGTYATSGNTTTLAGNLAAALNLCPAGTGLAAGTATNNGSSTVTVTANTWGSTPGVTLASTNTAVFAWAGTGGITDGSDGANLGTNFRIDNVNSDNATNLAAAITRNGGTIGVTGTAATNTVTITATPGTGGNSITTLNGLGSSLSLASGNLTGGSDGTASATTFPFWSVNAIVSNTQLAANIATTIAANGALNPLITATPGTGTLTLTATGDGPNYTVSANRFSDVSGTGTMTGGAAGGTAGQSPAKYSYATNSTVGPANCTSDYVIYPTAAPGSSTQATIIAYNNMYKGTCTGAVPAIFWAYNTGGTATLSPILNFEGTEVAYVQTTGGTASLVLLKMANSGSAVTAPTSVTAANYRACTAPCYTALSLGANDNDTNSAPWWDYAHDVIFVGDNAGKLHKFSGVFNGATPVEVGSPFATITPTAALGTLTGPVVDAATGNIYIGESYSGTNYPLMAQVTSAGAVTYSHAGARGTGLGAAYLDAPIVDQSAGRVYAFIGDDGATTGAKSSAVYQLTESTFTSALPIEAKLGTGSTGVFEYAGSFDNTYFNSAVPATPTGTLYVCGYASGVPTLYSIPITGATGMSTTATARTTLTGGGATCSPISEVDNGTSDYFFLSVTANGNKAGCEGACVYSYAGTPALPASGTLIPTASAPASGGAGEIIIDNTSSGGGSQIYYTTLSSQLCAGNGTTGSGTGACAVQESQSALQ